jgi:GTP-binding protein
LIESYLLQTPELKSVVLLLDCRLPPQETDRLMVDFARSHNVPLLSVLTKADKCNQRERAARQKEWGIFLRGELPLAVSSTTGLGIHHLWNRLREIANMPGPDLLPDTQIS